MRLTIMLILLFNFSFAQVDSVYYRGTVYTGEIISISQKDLTIRDRSGGHSFFTEKIDRIVASDGSLIKGVGVGTSELRDYINDFNRDSKIKAIQERQKRDEKSLSRIADTLDKIFYLQAGLALLSVMVVLLSG